MTHLPNIPSKDIIPDASRTTIEWLNKLKSAVNGHEEALDTKLGVVTDFTAEHFPFFTATGDLADSGKAAPTGDVVGTTDTQTMTNKTLTKPTIGDFTNADHDHGNAAGGGALAGSNGTLTAIVALQVIASTGAVQYKTKAYTFANGGMLTTIGTTSDWQTAASI